mmetsp:Transcript_52199/g.124427  ORF Transcript_52199/g.124427 Transcript_52199/m.124427 type:complete len:536 (-) Transcript_52199:96-1703(-)
MELRLLGAEGVPEGSLVSIRVGSVRRQAPLASDKRFRFDGAHQGKQHMKVDVYAPVAHGRLLIDPVETQCAVCLQTPDEIRGGDAFQVGNPNQEMWLHMEVKSAEAAGPEVPPEAVSAAKTDLNAIAEAAALQGSKDSKAGRHRVHLEAQPYFDQHHILEVMQGLLQGLIKEKPMDPYAYMIQVLVNSQNAMLGRTLPGQQQPRAGPQQQRERPPTAPVLGRATDPAEAQGKRMERPWSAAPPAARVLTATDRGKSVIEDDSPFVARRLAPQAEEPGEQLFQQPQPPPPTPIATQQADDAPLPPASEAPWTWGLPKPPSEEPTLLAVEATPPPPAAASSSQKPPEEQSRKPTAVFGAAASTQEPATRSQAEDAQIIDIRNKLRTGLSEAANAGTLEATLAEAFAVTPREDQADPSSSGPAEVTFGHLDVQALKGAVRTALETSFQQGKLHDVLGSVLGATSREETAKDGDAIEEGARTPTLGTSQVANSEQPEWFSLVSEETATLRKRTADLEEQVVVLRRELQRCMQQMSDSKS